MYNDKNFVCPVCGWDKLEEPPYGGKEGENPSYEICACCGYEFGYHDANIGYTFENYRKEWIKKGCPFYDGTEKPNVWNEEVMRKQLRNADKLEYKPRL